MLKSLFGEVFTGADSRKSSNSFDRLAVDGFLLSSTRCRELEHPELECRHSWMLFHAQDNHALRNAFWIHSHFRCWEGISRKGVTFCPVYFNRFALGTSHHCLLRTSFTVKSRSCAT